MSHTGQTEASCNVRKKGSEIVDGLTCFEDHRLELIWNTAVHNGTVPAAIAGETARVKRSETERNGAKRSETEPGAYDRRIEKRRVFATNL